MSHFIRIAVFLKIILLLVSCGESTEKTDTTDAEEQAMIESLRNTPTLQWNTEQQFYAYQNFGKVYPVRTISAGTSAHEFTYSAEMLTGLPIRYNGSTGTLAEFVEEEYVAGMLILRDDEIVYEYYADGITASTPWMTFSVAKTVVSLLYGAAVKDGYIDSLDDPVTNYLPELEGSAYDDVTIRHVLQMSSGVEWNEDYTDPESHVSRLDTLTSGASAISYMATLDRVAPPGTAFNYNTGETNVAGAVLREAIGMPLAEYASERIWKPFGFEQDGNWALLGEDDLEFGGCCISATLQDYGRMVRIALRDGVTDNGERILPENWIQESTQPGAVDNYGYFWWLSEGGSFVASGIFGQFMFIHPEEDMAIIILSYRPEATSGEYSRKRNALVRAVLGS